MASHILVAVDFSPASGRALEVAREYAAQLGARLHLLHVVWPGTDAGADPRLDALAAAGGVPTTTATASGVPATQIVEYARRHGIDLIVVGTHGRTGPSRLLLGSVAERVVRTAPCPVLTVPAVAPAVPAARGGEAHDSRCVVCARASLDLVCEACRARIRGEAVERKQRDERAGRA